MTNTGDSFKIGIGDRLNGNSQTVQKLEATKDLEEAIVRRYDAERKALMEDPILAAAICKDFVWTLDKAY